jgi:hypothetical protein
LGFREQKREDEPFPPFGAEFARTIQIRIRHYRSQEKRMASSNELRKRERLELSIPVRVRVKETHGDEWAELTHIIDVTQLGASFSLQHNIEAGRIVFLELPLPWRLRQYDQAADLYRIYALVRWVRSKGDANLVGVAFIGKNPPASYLRDPSRIYSPGRKSNERRREGRIQAALQVQLEILDDAGEVIGSEEAVTENISRRGASCYTTLRAAPGTRMRVTSPQMDFTTTAVVRRCRTGEDNIPRVHVEFVGAEWPLDIEPPPDEKTAPGEK